MRLTDFTHSETGVSQIKTPKAPDPVATANAQSGMNRDTAVSQNLINMVGQNNPWGSISYSPNGSTSFTDSSGKAVIIPQFTQTTTFTPEQQAIFDKSQQAELNMAGIASDQSAKLGKYLNDPFQFNNQDAADWAYDMGASRIRPEQARNEEMLRSRLVNSGIRPGSEGHMMEMTRLDQSNTDQWNQLALQGRGQAFGEALATRNQPINEITALLSGSQVSNPATMSGPTPQSSVAGVDYTGLVNQQYQSKLAQSNAMMGGLFGLAGSLGGAAITKSDRRVKTDIERIGTAPNGLPWYSFRYIWDAVTAPQREGLMAQDVLQVNPDAVVTIGGVLHVDYGKALA